MSLAKVLPYFQNKMELLGYEEWEDEFNIDNIPRSMLDRAYHLEIGLIDGSEASHTCFEFDFPVVLTIHSCLTVPRGSSKEAQAMIEVSDNILCNILKLEDRYCSEVNGFQKIVPTSVEFEPLSLSNDNVVRVKFTFGVQVKEEYR